MHLKDITHLSEAHAKRLPENRRHRHSMNKTARKISRLPSFSRERNILSFNKELSVSQSAQMQNNNTTQTILTEHCQAVATSPQADKALAENRAVHVG